VALVSHAGAGSFLDFFYHVSYQSQYLITKVKFMDPGAGPVWSEEKR